VNNLVKAATFIRTWLGADNISEAITILNHVLPEVFTEFVAAAMTAGAGTCDVALRQTRFELDVALQVMDEATRREWRKFVDMSATRSIAAERGE
jgi:hypothetical protein